MLTDAPPDLELLAAVEHDMAKVDQALRDLDDDESNPEDAVAWLPAPASAGATDLADTVDAPPAEVVSDEAASPQAVSPEAVSEG